MSNFGHFEEMPQVGYKTLYSLDLHSASIYTWQVEQKPGRRRKIAFNQSYVYKFALKILLLHWKSQELPGASPPGPHAARLTRLVHSDCLHFAQVLLDQWGTQPSLVPRAPSSKVTPVTLVQHFIIIEHNGNNQKITNKLMLCYMCVVETKWACVGSVTLLLYLTVFCSDIFIFSG